SSCYGKGPGRNSRMRFSMVWLISLVATALCPLAKGQDLPPAKDTLPQTMLNEGQKGKSVFDDPLGGVVVNRTVTVLGNDFYQDFTALWRQKDISNKFSISIYERPS